MRAQVDRGQVCRTGLGLFSIGLHVLSNAPPDVGLIGHVEWEHKVVVSSTTQDCAGRSISRNARSGRRRASRHGWVVVGTVIAQGGSRLLKLRLCGFQVLIRYIDLEFQRVQLRILKNGPPITTKILVIGFGGLPVPYLFIGRRSLYRRLVVLRTNHT